MKRVYDIILSLGGSCAVANQLKCRGLRLASYPFDWIFTKEPLSLERLSECFRDGFVNWMKPENLVDIGVVERNLHAAKYQYRDTYTGFRFIHDFIEKKEKCIKQVRQKYLRRIERMYSRLRCAKRIALCFDADFKGSEVPLISIRELILEKFGADKEVDCYLVEFKAPQHEIVQNGPLTIYRFTHSKHDYIFGNQVSFEFAYMDDFSISDMFKSEERGKGNKCYLAHTAHGMKCILFKNKKKIFSLDVGIGSRKYEFLIGNSK